MYNYKFNLFSREIFLYKNIFLTGDKIENFNKIRLIEVFNNANLKYQVCV